MADVKTKIAGVKPNITDQIKTKIVSKKVVVYSKSSCPYCKKAKDVLKQYNIPKSDIDIIEIANDPKCNAIQSALQKVTGARTVPRVFINGKCIGGGNETEALHRSGKLKGMLGL
ncbi:glutaredoxin-1 [Lingula anatina]|uniref:Glutaredoxin-1 n=1 Tax=Lingula anatina TaxID=7574 RepID=A0A1S3GZN1_LINAN|nr:glutaredoxin-1 [Lingula anatina]|eukprot:XP_013378691.1 glutaredoxin-1 [Lingula anatina]